MNQTPASNETKLGILNHNDLNEHEALGLKKTWDFLIAHREVELSSQLVNQAHKEGFGFLYQWAGKYRTTTPIVGNLEPPAPHLITELTHNLFEDLKYRLKELDADNLESVVKLLTWFEHRFIVIHPYANTNGRMGRMLSNYILIKLGFPLLNYSNRSSNRDEYINAVRQADDKNYSPLEILIAKELEHAILSNE
jgi:fido (protein-threonine AMPylation protein)